MAVLPLSPRNINLNKFTIFKNLINLIYSEDNYSKKEFLYPADTMSEDSHHPETAVPESQMNVRVIPPNLQEICDEYVSGSFRGADLEKKVADVLRQIPGDEYHVLQNVYVPNPGEGRTTEIDVLLIHPAGIYVFECKDYHAGIYTDDPHAKSWKAEYRARTYCLTNPINQNESHIHALEYCLGRCHSFRSWIVFGDGAYVDVSWRPGKFRMIRFYRLRRDITLALSKERRCFSREEVERIYEKLLPFTGEDARRNHIVNQLADVIRTGYDGFVDSAENTAVLRAEIMKCLLSRNNHDHDRIRAKPQRSFFYPDGLQVTGPLCSDKLEKYPEFYDWVGRLDHRRLAEFCRILLEGNGFSAIHVEDTVISAQGDGRAYLFTLSNLKRKLCGHDLEVLDSKFWSVTTEILIVVSSRSYSPEAVRAAKNYGMLLWDCDSLRRLMVNAETTGSSEQQQNLKRFLANAGYR